MAVLLAFLAAVAFAFGAVLQQKGTLETSAGEGDARFLVQVLRRPVWLLGGLMQVLGWVLQAVALDRGSLVVVQAVCALSLVIALPIGARLTAQRIGRREYVGALAATMGIVVFLAAGQPSGGTDQPSASAWWSASLLSLVIVSVAWTIARHRSGSVAAVIYGSAAGICFGFQAAVTKVWVDSVGSGVVELLGEWTTYALIASALLGFVLQQSALKTGILAPAMASSNALTLIASVAYGTTVFGETLGDGSGHQLASIVGLSSAVVGIVVLGRAQGPAISTPEPAVAAG